MKTFFTCLIILLTQVGISQNCLIANYPFRGNAMDSIGSNNGTVHGATLVADRFGNANEAYQFNGTDNWIELDGPLADLTEMSISVWIKYEGNSRGVIFCDNDNVPNKDFLLDVSSNGIGVKADKGSATLNYQNGMAVGVAFNGWHHVVWTMSPTESKIYYDGTLVRTINESASQVGNHGVNAAIGVFDDGTPLEVFYQGALDDLRIYDCVLTQGQVTDLYVPGSCEIARYWFNGNANDNVGNNHGIVHGATLSPDRYGNVNGSYYFDGVDDWIELSDALPDMTEFSIGAWIKYEGPGTGTIISDSDNTPNKDLVLDVTPTGIGVKADKGSAVLSHINGTAATGFNLAGWHHIVWTMAPTESKIYFDGNLQATLSETGSQVGFHHSYATIGVFDDGTPHERLFQGYIDDLRIYDCVINDVDVTDIYTSVQSKVKPDEITMGVFPNPTDEFLNIDYRHSSKPQTIRIVDVSGKEVYSSDYRQRIDVSRLDVGIYFIQVIITTGELAATRKFVKK